MTLCDRAGRGTEDSAEAIAELKTNGAVVRAQAATLDRLVRLKPKSQYQAAPISASDATKATASATRLSEAAEGVVLQFRRYPFGRFWRAHHSPPIRASRTT